MSAYELWCEHCVRERKEELYKLEESGDPETGLFKLVNTIGNGIPCYNLDVTYHVWINGKWLYVGNNYIEAYNTYNAFIGGHEY